MAVCQRLLLPSMPRFHCPQPLLPGTTVDLPETVAHHLHVVRQQPGDELVLFNGEGGQVRARLLEVGKRRASAEVIAHEALDAELPVLRCRAGEDMIRRCFEPLGYAVDVMRLPLDSQFPEWGESDYYD